MAAATESTVTPERIRVLVFHENATATGIGRVALGFATAARQPQPGLPTVEITFVTYRRNGQQTGFAAAALAAGIPVIEIPERGRWDLKVMPHIRRVVRDFKPDILQTHNIKSHAMVRATGLHREFPWIAWNHGYTSKNRLDRAYNQIDRWSLHGAFRLIAVCGPFAAALQEMGIPRDKVTVLHNFVDAYVRPSDDEVLRLRRQMGIGDELTIVTVGRMSVEKGYANLFSAIALLKDKAELPKHRFVLVGDGPEEGNLRRQAAQLGIEDRLVWAGFQKNVAPYYCDGEYLRAAVAVRGFS